MNIYITSDNDTIAGKDLRGLFREFGSIRWTRIVNTSSGKKYALVEMTDDAAARNAVDHLNGICWHDSLISVSLSCLQVVHRNRAEKNIFFI
jgi:RNA recognition motif-containing protein